MEVSATLVATTILRSATRVKCTDSRTKLIEAGARPTVAWGIDFFAHWPYVKNLVPHHSLYSFGRMQNVWLDR